MENKIIIKNGAGAPNNQVLDEAELGYDRTGKKLYSGNGYGKEATCVNPFDISFDNIQVAPDELDANLLGGLAADDYITIDAMNNIINSTLVSLHAQILNGAW